MYCSEAPRAMRHNDLTVAKEYLQALSNNGWAIHSPATHDRSAARAMKAKVLPTKNWHLSQLVTLTKATLGVMVIHEDTLGYMQSGCAE